MPPGPVPPNDDRLPTFKFVPAALAMPLNVPSKVVNAAPVLDALMPSEFMAFVSADDVAAVE